MKYNAIIFDFNGVLLWDTAWQNETWDRAAEKLRGYPMTDEEQRLHVHGRTNHEIIAYLLGREPTAQEIADHINFKEGMYREIAIHKGREFTLCPGAVELFEILIANNIPHTIATGSEITNLRFFIENLHLDRWFEVDKIVYDNGIRPGKPAPDIYVEAAAMIKTPPEACIVVEDAISGIESAHSAGIGKIIALGPNERHARLSATPGVSRVVTDLHAITLADFTA